MRLSSFSAGFGIPSESASTHMDLNLNSVKSFAIFANSLLAEDHGTWRINPDGERNQSHEGRCDHQRQGRTDNRKEPLVNQSRFRWPRFGREDQGAYAERIERDPSSNFFVKTCPIFDPYSALLEFQQKFQRQAATAVLHSHNDTVDMVPLDQFVQLHYVAHAPQTIAGSGIFRLFTCVANRAHA